MKKLLNRFWLAVLWSAITIILLSIPGSDLPEESSFLNIPNFDKWVHFGLFALFVVLWCWALRTRNRQANLISSFILITITAIALGYAMELVQKYIIPNRDYDMWDVAADGVGAVAGLIFSIITFRKR